MYKGKINQVLRLLALNAVDKRESAYNLRLGEASGACMSLYSPNYFSSAKNWKHRLSRGGQYLSFSVWKGKHQPIAVVSGFVEPEGVGSLIVSLEYGFKDFERVPREGSLTYECVKKIVGVFETYTESEGASVITFMLEDVELKNYFTSPSLGYKCMDEGVEDGDYVAQVRKGLMLGGANEHGLN